MAFPPEQRVFIVESYIKGRSYKLCRQLFLAKYPGVKPPAKATIQKLVEKFRRTGSILNVAKERSKTALTLNKLNEINERLQANPGKSLRRLSAQTGVSFASVHRATKLLGSKDFKIAACHALRPADRARRLQFCNWIFGQIAEGLIDPNLLFFSDEAWFHSNGYVTTQHERWWAPENPHHLHEVPLPEFKVGVWCAVSSRRIVGPIFFYEPLDSEHYVSDVLQPFLGQLSDEERTYGWFQQDHVLGRTACKSPAALRGVFEARIIGSKHWPARSPDLNVCSFFLWGYLKDRVYQNYPCTAGDLEENVRGAVRNIPADVLTSQVISEFMRRNQLCLQEKGDQFCHLSENGKIVRKIFLGSSNPKHCLTDARSKPTGCDPAVKIKEEPPNLDDDYGATLSMDVPVHSTESDVSPFESPESRSAVVPAVTIKDEPPDWKEDGVEPATYMELPVFCMLECEPQHTPKCGTKVVPKSTGAKRLRRKTFMVAPIKVVNCREKCFCHYCGRVCQYEDLVRHLKAWHCNETEVAIILEYYEDGDASDPLWHLLRNRGNHINNVRTLATGRGLFVVSSLTDRHCLRRQYYRPCTDCLEFYIKGEMRRHACPGRHASKLERTRVPTPIGLSSCIDRLLGGMQQDDVIRAVGGDPAVREWAAKLLVMHNGEVQYYPCIRQRLKTIGQLLLAIRGQTGLEKQSLAEALDPAHYPAVAAAVKDVEGLDVDAGKLWLILHQSALMCRATSIRARQGETAQKCNRFLGVCTSMGNISD